MTMRSYKGVYVFDTGAFALFFGGYQPIKPFFDEVFRGDCLGVTCTLLLCEFWYKTCEKLGKDAANDFYERIITSEIQVVDKLETAKVAAELKCKYRKQFSFVDCHALSLAKLYSGKLVTTDSAFKNVDEVEVIYIKPPEK